MNKEDFEALSEVDKERIIEGQKAFAESDGKVLVKNDDGTFTRVKQENVATYKENQLLENIYYDLHGLFWLWNERALLWEIKDEVDVLNLFEKNGYETKKQKTKTYCLNVAKQDGRKNKLLELPEFSICFNDAIYDLVNKKEIPLSKKYFITSKIPYNLSISAETPKIDALFTQWVGDDNKEILYEIMAYASLREQFLQRWFALTGAGSNGKGTFNNLLMKFLGKENCVSSSIKALINRTFETSALYKKLVCFIGEADSHDLSNTNLIKQLTGEDLIRFEFKGKTSFSDLSPTTFIMNTNSLPKTPDKSDGFYRRVYVIPFPNQFKITPNLLETIPSIEFEALTRKIVNAALRLMKEQKFSGEGSIEDRRRIYEAHSSPLMIFIDSFYDEDGKTCIKLRDFAKAYNQFRKDKKLRVLTIHQIGAELREEGFEISPRKYKNEDGEITDSAKSIIGLAFKENSQYIEKNGSLGSQETIKLPELPKFTIGRNNLSLDELEAEFPEKAELIKQQRKLLEAQK